MSDDNTPLDPLRTIRGDGLPAAKPLDTRKRMWIAIAAAAALVLLLGLMIVSRNRQVALQAAADQSHALAQAERPATDTLSASEAAASNLAASNAADAQASRQEHESHDAATTAAQAAAPN